MRPLPLSAPLAAALVLAVGLACKQPAPEPGSDPATKPASEPNAEPAAEPAAAPAPTEPPTAAAVTPSGETRSETVEGLALLVPVEWSRAPASSSMRKAEFVLPGAGGEARLVVYRFPGGAGSTTQNIERWQGQIEGGEPATTATLEVNGLKVTSVDARGRFAGQQMPGAPAQPPIPDARMFAAAIEGEGDPYYFKLVGPAATIDAWAPAWTELLAKLAPAA